MELQKYKIHYLAEFKKTYAFIQNETIHSFGEVQIYNQQQTNQKFLIKQIDTHTPQEREQLLQKIQQIITNLNKCTNLIHLIGYTELPQYNEDQKNTFYLVYEYFPNTLDQEWPIMIQEEGIDSVCKRVFNQISYALLWLEQQGIKHMDIRLQNIAVSKENSSIKVIFSHFENHSLELASSLSSQNSQKCENIFKPPCDQNPDVYSFGVLILFLTSFKHPKRKIEDLQTNKNLLSQLLANNGDIKIPYTKDFWEFLASMTAKEPTNRTSMQNVYNKLKNIQIYRQNETLFDDKIFEKVEIQDLNIPFAIQQDILDLKNKPVQQRAQLIKNTLFNTKKDENKVPSKYHTPAKKPILTKNWTQTPPKTEPVMSYDKNRTSMQYPSYFDNRISRMALTQCIYSSEYFQNIIRDLECQIIYDNIEENLYKEGIQRKEYLDGSVYIGELSQQSLRQGKGIYYYKKQGLTQEIYAGEWKDNMFEGQGLYLFSSGDRFEGCLSQGQKHGRGTYYYVNGNIYEGDWANDLKHGNGILYFTSFGEKYVGDFKDGVRHGQGSYYFKNGDVFNGEWAFGIKEGAGQVFFADGSVFTGVWKNNYPNGNGKMNYANGDVYEGNYATGQKDHDGVYLHQDANSAYQGAFKLDEPEGVGVFQYKNGDVYDGQVSKGNRHGKGVYVYANGDKYDGEFKQDKKHGNGTLYFANGNIFEGIFVNGQMKGYGKMTYENGDIYKGNWTGDQKHGKGEYIWAQGEKFQGTWKFDKMNGKGVFTEKNGKIIRGLWQDDKHINIFQ